MQITIRFENYMSKENLINKIIATAIKNEVKVGVYADCSNDDKKRI